MGSNICGNLIIITKLKIRKQPHTLAYTNVHRHTHKHKHSQIHTQTHTHTKKEKISSSYDTIVMVEVEEDFRLCYEW